MRLRELFELKQDKPKDTEEVSSGLKTIGVAFGRFNPPHRGHKAVWQSASTNPIWFIGTNQSTSGPKDPLPYDVKLQAMAAVWSKVKGHVIPEQSLLTLASRIYEKYGESVHLKVYTDEEWLINTLQQYNGASDKPHGMYKFNQIEWVKTERLASATNLRAAVKAGDRESFYKDMGIKPDVTIRVGDQDLPIFDVVAHYLNQYPEKTKKSEVAEGSVGKGGTKTIDKEKKAAMRNALTMPDLNMSTGRGGAYMNYRMAIALAGAPNFPTKMEADNWIGGDPLLSSYTEEEFEMVKAAAKQVGAGTIQNWSGKRSKEMADVNKTSTVAKPKKNKYGV
jgi:nicotinamide mononucleotide adenylyltransferase